MMTFALCFNVKAKSTIKIMAEAVLHYIGDGPGPCSSTKMLSEHEIQHKFTI